jgi:hypothetical protein
MTNDPPPGEREGLTALLGRVLLLMGDFVRAREVWQKAEHALAHGGSREAILSARLRQLEASFLEPDSDRRSLLRSVEELRAEA